jgi:hypothetical protein
MWVGLVHAVIGRITEQLKPDDRERCRVSTAAEVGRHVFIDDLDRYSPFVVTQVIEAINLLVRLWLILLSTCWWRGAGGTVCYSRHIPTLW